MSRRFAISVLAACLAGTFAAGCDIMRPAASSNGQARPPSAAAAPDPAEVLLAEAAARAEAALTALAGMRAAELARPAGDVQRGSPVSGNSPVPTDVPPALRRPVTLDWIGPVETVAESLARYAGYRFSAAGAAPVRPVMVVVSAERTPVIEMLRDIGLQAGSAATLVVDAGSGTVRLDWSAAGGGKE